MAASVTAHTSAEVAPELARTLCSAFSEDPVTKYFLGPDFGKAKGRLKMERTFEIFAADSLRHTEAKPGKKSQVQTEVHASKDNKCVALWQKPGPLKDGPIAELRMLFKLCKVLGWSTFLRAGALLRAIEKYHPKEPHMYLKMLGTALDEQGKGIGSVVMGQMTKRLDEEGIAAYLESSNEKNIPFYQRHGFEIMDRPIPGLPRGAPVITSMWREPKSK